MSAPGPFAAPGAGGAGTLAQTTLALCLVLALIFVLAWLVRRMRGAAKTNAAALDVLAQLPLGPRERAVLIRCGSRQILLGVAPGRVSLLHALPEPLELAPVEPAQSRPPASDFRSVLRRSLGL